MLFRNQDGQYWRVFAFYTSGANIHLPVLGDAANITADIGIDGGSGTPLGTTNPTETQDGFYNFPLTAAETDGTQLDIFPESSTVGVQVIGVPGSHFTQLIALTSSLTELTSQEEIERVFSTEGVTSHTEDVVANTTIIDEIVQRATETVLAYLRVRFQMEDMVTSYWVRMKATYIACYYVSIRLGNPSLYGDLFAESMIDLAQARDGVINIGIPTKTRALVQTPMMDSRYFHPARVNPQQSTKVYPGQRLPYRLGNYE